MMFYDMPTAMIGAIMTMYLYPALNSYDWPAIYSYHSCGFDFAAIYKARKNNQRGKIIRRQRCA